MKVDYFAREYARMHRGVRPHPVRITADNVAELIDADLVFLTMDANLDKKILVEALTAARVPFIDTGIGVSNDPHGIAGQIRITTSTPGRDEHISRDGLISYISGDDAEYDTNLQVAELNMMAAFQAVMQFKKLYSFYAAGEDERHSIYVTETNEIHNRYGREHGPTEAATVEPTSSGDPDFAA
jgi:hypothetical protein